MKATYGRKSPVIDGGSGAVHVKPQTARIGSVGLVYSREAATGNGKAVQGQGIVLQEGQTANHVHIEGDRGIDKGVGRVARMGGNRPQSTCKMKPRVGWIAEIRY